MSRGHLAAFAAAAALLLAAPSVAQANSFPLMGWWPMNEGSGQTVRDWSGRGNHGFLGSTTGVDDNDPSWIRGVFLGSALRFGGGDYVTIPGSRILEPAQLTVGSWVRGEGSPGQYKYVMSKGSVACDASSYGLYTGEGGGLAFYIANDAKVFFRSPEAASSVWDGKWHHVAGTFDGRTVRLFVDGKQVGSGTPAVTAINYDLDDDGGRVGGYGGIHCDADLTLTGDVDGVQVWSQALQVDKIWAILKPIVSLAR